MAVDYLQQAANSANTSQPSSGYLDTFLKYYNNMNTQAGQGMWQPNYTGQTYNVGNAGMGYTQPNAGGLGQFDVGSSGLGKYNVNNVGQGQFDLSKYLNMGTGSTYNSDLLNQLTGRVSENLANPNATKSMGLAKDWITGQGEASRQELDNSLAGLGRSGAANQQRDQLNSSLNRTASDMYRQIAVDAEKQSIADAMGLEGLKGGFFSDAKNREMGLAGIDASSFENSQNRALNLENMKMGADENSLQRQLQNASLGSQAYSDAQNRAMQYSTLEQSAIQDALNRELQNAQLGGSMYNADQDRIMQALGMSQSGYENAKNRELAGSQANSGNLNQLASMLQWAGSSDATGSQQNFNNLLSLAQLQPQDYIPMTAKQREDMQWTSDLQKAQNTPQQQAYQPLTSQQMSDMQWMQSLQGGGGQQSTGNVGFPETSMGGFGMGQSGIGQAQASPSYANQASSTQQFDAQGNPIPRKGDISSMPDQALKDRAMSLINQLDPRLQQEYKFMMGSMNSTQLSQFILSLMESVRRGTSVWGA